jgi:hypothetical protein
MAAPMMMLQSELTASFRQIAAFVEETPAFCLDVDCRLEHIPAATENILDHELP